MLYANQSNEKCPESDKTVENVFDQPRAVSEMRRWMNQGTYFGIVATTFPCVMKFTVFTAVARGTVPTAAFAEAAFGCWVPEK